MKKITAAIFFTIIFCAVFLQAHAYAAVYKGTPMPMEQPVNSEYGRLIWKQDFDGYSSVGDYSYDPSYASPYASAGAALGNSDYVYAGDGDAYMPVFNIVENPVTKTGGALSIKGSRSYAIYKINFDGDILSRPGKYTLVVNGYKADPDLKGKVRFYVNRCYKGTSEIGNLALGTDRFEKCAYSFTVCTPDEFKASGLDESAYTTNRVFAFQYAYLFFSGAEGKTGYFDDIELWYDEYADVTFHIDSSDADIMAAADMLMPVKHQSLAAGTSLPALPVSGTGYVFVGWSKVKDDANAIINEVEPGEYDLYAIFEDGGSGEELYSYDDKMTVYEAVMLLMRMDASVHGRESELPDGIPFSDYLAYAEKHGVLPKLSLDRYDRAVLRSEVAEMLYAVLPKNMLKSINSVAEIPDIKDYDAFAEQVLALYRAGILAGVDENRSFKPYEDLRRCDFDELLTRVFYQEERERFTLSVDSESSVKMLYDKEIGKTFKASYISAPESYLETLEELPAAALNVGKWITTTVTRSHLRMNVNVNKPVSKALLEYQSDNPFDFMINGTLVPETKNSEGWHLTGVADVTNLIRQGSNALAIRGFSSDDMLHAVSAIRGTLEITYTDGTTDNFDSGSGWKNGAVCNYWVGTEPAGWETAAIPSGYSAVSAFDTHPRLRRRSCLFRTDFNSDKEVKSAYLYASAKGLYVPYMNGKRVSDARFLPGSMEKLTEYQAFDVTALIKNGINVLAAETGNGFYNCGNWGGLTYKIPAVIMQLEIEYADGSVKTIASDNSWEVTASPLIDNDLQYGERYDARMEINGWNSAEEPDGEWVNAQEVTFDNLPEFANQTYPAVTVRDEVRAQRMLTLDDGSVCYDFRYNSAGRAKIVLKNTKPGEVVLIRYCELLDGNEPVTGVYGDVYFAEDTLPGGRAPYGLRNIDVYICKGADEEVYIPEFTYTGFRYIYVSGYTGEYTLGTVRKMEMNTDLEETGDFTTSHEGLAKIWDAVKRSYRSNAFTGPTDCPTREKNFWNGDIQMFCATACWYMDNNSFLSRWTEAGHKIEYNVYGWEDEEYILPLTLYRYYGNKEILETKYPVIKALIAKRESWLSAGQTLPTDHSPYNDHKAIKNVPTDFYAAAFFCRMYKDSAEIARILGKTEDAQAYEAKFETARKAFNSKYYRAEQKDYTPGHQGGIVIPVAFGIAEEKNIPGLMETLHKYVVSEDYHMTCGFTGAERILGLLCDYGYGEDAWKIISGDTYPSLLNMLSTHTGGTTTESWNGYSTTNGSSMNHYAIGGISRWFFEHLGGITITEPGFDSVRIKPYFYKELGDACVTYDSAHGTVSSAWEYQAETDTFVWTVVIPEGMTAVCELPEGVAFVDDAGNGGKRLTEGTYTFIARKDAFVPGVDYNILNGANIVCIGDSLTQGDYGSNPPGTMNVKAENYPYFLAQLTGANVTNAGKCGYSAKLYWDYLDKVTALNYDTDLVLIMLGTNQGLTDTIEADTASGNASEYADTQTGNYAKIIEAVKQKTGGQAQIILMTPPVTTLRDRTVLETTVSVIQKFGKKYGLNVIDNYHNCGITYDNIDTYMPIDKLHCGYDGYKLLAEYITGEAAKYYSSFVPEDLPAEYEEKPADYDETYGNLVYFDNFSGEDFKNTADVKIFGVSDEKPAEKDGRMAKKGAVIESTASNTVSGVMVAAKDGIAFRYADGREMVGKLTLVYHDYVDSAGVVSKDNFFDACDSPSMGTKWVGYYTRWGKYTRTFDTWNAPNPAGNFNLMSWDTKSGITKFGIIGGGSYAAKGAYYVSDVSVYFMPESAVKLVDDEKTVLIDLNGMTSYEFPLLDSGRRWISSDGGVYSGGEQADASMLIGKTFKAVLYAEDYNETYGNLVYFDNFSGEDFNNAADVTILGISDEETVEKGGRMAKRGAPVESTVGNTISGVMVAAKDGKTFRYADGKEMVGKLTLVYHDYADSAGGVTKDNFFDACDSPSVGTKWIGYYTRWGKYERTYDTWNAPNPAKNFNLMSWDTKSGITKFGIIGGGSWAAKGAYYVSDVSVYFMPESAVKLVDGEKTVLIDLNGMISYEFPQLDGGRRWISGDGGVYSGGEQADASELIGKTFEAQHYEEDYRLDYNELTDDTIGYVGRWYDKTVDGVKCKATISQGAEMYFKVKNTQNVLLRLHSGAAQPPALAVSVDGSAPERMISSLTGDFCIAQNLSPDEHTVRVIVDGFYEYQADKWTTGDGFAVEKVVVDNGGTVIGILPSNPVIMYFGDSITEGINVLGTGSTPTVNSAVNEYPFTASHLLGAVSYTNGFGASGVTKGGSGGVPKCLSVIDNILADAPITDVPKSPYAIVVNHGHNDPAGGTFVEEYTAVLERLREKYPDTPIFAVTPFKQKHDDEIKQVVDTLADEKIFYISTAGWSYTTTDNAHPDKAGAKALGEELANAMKDILDPLNIRDEDIENHSRIPLWQADSIPFERQDAANSAYMRAYLVDGADSAVVIYPGGGYQTLSEEGEGSAVAQEYNKAGISAFVVSYRYKPYNGDAILADGQRGVQTVRYYADRFGIDKEKIAVCGFSAGGHLATMVCCHAPESNTGGDLIGLESSAPNACILGYAVTTLGDGTYYSMPGIFLGDNSSDPELIAKYSYPYNISAMPPAFVFYSRLDTAVDYRKNSEALVSALQDAGKTVVSKGYSDGKHGVGLASAYPEMSGWHASSVEFLKDVAFAED